MMGRLEIESPKWALILVSLKFRRRLLQDQFGQLKLHGHRIVAGEARVAEPAIGATDYLHQPFDIQVA